ncbi:MAG: helix-turn-helix domain-containing protein [Candidatus Altiarchaeota archaeon]
MTSKDMLAKTIAGEITLSKRPSETLRKWREIFGVRQAELAEELGVTPSVISDYEKARRKTPGTTFIKKYVEALIGLDESTGGKVTEKLSPETETAILDIRELLEPVRASRFVKIVEGEVIANKHLLKKELDGYTVVDSIQAILKLSDRELGQIYGTSSRRAIVFTKVTYGRSPMVAIKVTHHKPAMVVLHGLKPEKVDKLAKHIAEIEGITLVVTRMEDEEELVRRLREKIL